MVFSYRFDHRARPGCAMIVFDANGHVLLVRHSYCDPLVWMLPAGRIGRRERARAAASRELVEEIGCRLQAIELVEFEDTEYWGRRYRTYIFDGSTTQAPLIDMREIDEAAFFPLDKLPDTVNLATKERLERWKYRRSFPVRVPAFIRPDYLSSGGLGSPGS